MALERDRNGGSRAIPVLGHDQVGLTSSRRFPLVGIFAMQKDDYVRILFNTIMQVNAVGNEIMRSGYSRIIYGLLTDAFE